jgi:hypothetical protein
LGCGPPTLPPPRSETADQVTLPSAGARRLTMWLAVS